MIIKVYIWRLHHLFFWEIALDIKLIFFANAVLLGLCELMDCEVMGDNTSESKRFSFKSPMCAAGKPFQDSWQGSRSVLMRMAGRFPIVLMRKRETCYPSDERAGVKF